MRTHALKVEKTAKVCTLGNLDEAVEVWIVLHGYGMLAQYFIRHFTALQEAGIAVIAPEAMSRFYTEGFSGRVGASWMTKEERQTDIEDYLHYLNTVYQHFNLTDKKVTLLGFSQGGATAARWFVQDESRFDRLIFWASLIPPDFDFQKVASAIQSGKCELVVGTRDPFRSTEYYEQIKRLVELYPQIKVTEFEGKHEIDEVTLRSLLT